MTSGRPGGRVEGPRSRRSVLAALASGVGVSGSLAGCVDGETVDGPVAEDPAVFAVRFPHLPADVQLNPWSGVRPTEVTPLFFETPSVLDPAGRRRLGGPVADAVVDGRTVSITYVEGYSWWNGEPVTARDRWVEQRIQSFVDRNAAGGVPDGVGEVVGDHDAPGEVAVDRVHLPDDYTIVYEFEEQLSRELALDRTLGSLHDVAAWRFEEHLAELQDAATETDLADAVTRLRTDRIGMENAMDEGYGCAPYELVEVSLNRLVMDPAPAHPRSEDLAVPRLWLPVSPTRGGASMVADGILDGGTGLLETMPVEPAPGIEQLSRYPTHLTTKLLCNWRAPHLDDRNVRRALACAIPLPDAADFGDFGEPVDVPTGLAPAPRDRWLSESHVDSLHRYPLAADTERAAAFMRRAGYERAGGTWSSPGGRSVVIDLRAPAGSEWAVGVRSIARALDEFGIEAEVRELQSGTFATDVFEGNFGLAPWWHDGRPRRAFALPEPDPATLGHSVRRDSATSLYGKRATATTPVEPGEVPAGPGGRTELDLLAQWDAIRAPSSEGDARDAVARMASWWNADVPDLLLGVVESGVWGNVDDFSWPADDDPALRRFGPGGRPELQLLNRGAIRPVGAE